MKKEQNYWIPFVGFIFMIIAVIFFWIALPNFSAKSPAPTPTYSETIQQVKVVQNELDFKTPALYFFSAVAQTMGALLAISFAVLYTKLGNLQQGRRYENTTSDNVTKFPDIVGNKKADESELYYYLNFVLTNKYVYSILLNDESVRNSINFGLGSILVSVLALFLLLPFYGLNILFLFILFVVFVAASTFSIISVFSMYQFVFRKFIIYSSSKDIVAENTKFPDNKIQTKYLNNTVDISIIMLLNPGEYAWSGFNGEQTYTFINNIINTYEEKDWEEKLLELTNITNEIKKIPQRIQSEVYKKIAEILVKGCYFYMFSNSQRDDKQKCLSVLLSKILCKYFISIPEDVREDIIKESIKIIEKHSCDHQIFSLIFFGYAFREYYLIRHLAYKKYIDLYHNQITNRIFRNEISREYQAIAIFYTLVMHLNSILFEANSRILALSKTNQQSSWFYDFLRELMCIMEANESWRNLGNTIFNIYPIEHKDRCSCSIYILKSMLGLPIELPLKEYINRYYRCGEEPPAEYQISSAIDELDRYIKIFKDHLRDND